MPKKIVSKSLEIGGKILTLETGEFAGQANGAVVARYGDTMVLATVAVGKEIAEADFVPLQVEYLERLYAGGKIKGSRWVKREGRSSDEGILIARLIDRSIRPLFPKNYRREVQLIITVLSVDGANNPDIPSICAASAALMISDIPWQGPVFAMRIGYIAKEGIGDYVINPTHQDMDYSEMDLVAAGNGDSLVMVESGSNEVGENIVVGGLELSLREGQKIVDLIKDFGQEVKTKKAAFVEVANDVQMAGKIEKEIKTQLAATIKASSLKEMGSEGIQAIKDALVEEYGSEKRTAVYQIVDILLKEAVRSMILEKGERPDGRKMDEVRELDIKVGLLPRTHGSALFRRGNSQALTVTTLGAPSLGQLIESMEGEETKRYMHHYYMSPFSVGEVGRMGWPGRREIGHGALAERALEPVLPSEDEFPYAIRVVSEILSSNGSTSMASVCGSTLSLMDAGVPIKSPVAGIAMGLVSEGKKYQILTDIVGLEDFNGDMDFKVAGTKKGITAIQMDVKKIGITAKILAEALEKAKTARIFILEKMLAVLPSSRSQVSKLAPKVKVLHIPKDRIGEVIGPGGRVIRQLIEETGAMIDVEDDGSINVTATDAEAVEKAVARIEGLTKQVVAGEVYDGTVTRIQPFGVFVEILPGKEGLVHVSRMSRDFVQDPAALVNIGDKVRVHVAEIDELGRTNLSMLFDENGQPLQTQLRKPSPRPMAGGMGRERFSPRPFRPRR